MWVDGVDSGRVDQVDISGRGGQWTKWTGYQLGVVKTMDGQGVNDMTVYEFCPSNAASQQV